MNPFAPGTTCDKQASRDRQTITVVTTGDWSVDTDVILSAMNSPLSGRQVQKKA